MDNVSAMTVFTLSGLNGTAKYRIPLFIATFLFYILIWLVNVTLIVTIVVDRNLHEPMYIFLCNLCINGLYGTAGFYPKFLMDLVSTAHVITYAGCLLQGFVIHSSVSADFSLLTLMALDRYVAICQPLVYHSVMTKQRICLFVFLAWLLPMYLVFVGSIMASIQRLCGSHIPKIYCINYLVNRLACTADIASSAIPAFNYTFYFCHFVVVLWSYCCLSKTCQNSKENTSKFMQTCLPHLFCLTSFGISLIFDLLYVRFGSQTIPQGLQNFMSIEFLVVPPILNPLIYGLKLTQVRHRIEQFLWGKRVRPSHNSAKKKKACH